MDIYKLRSNLKSRFDEKLDTITTISAVIGDGEGNVWVSGRDKYVYCRTASGIEQVLCTKIQPEHGMWVTIGVDPMDPPEKQVLTAENYMPGSSNSGIVTGPAPAIRYQWMANGGGQDPLFVELRQFLPLRVGVYLGMLIEIYAGAFKYGTSRITVSRQTKNLSSHIPSTAGKAAAVLITIDSSGTVVATKGSEVDIANLAITDIPAAPAGTVLELAAVRVYNGQTAVQESRVNTDIIDLRQGAMPNIHDAVTVTDSATVDFTLSNQNITASVIPAGIKLDDLGTPDDNTDLDASSARHGLLPKLPGDSAKYLDGTGSWATPSGGGGGGGDLTFNVQGALSSSTSSVGYYIVPRTGTIQYIYISCDTTGSASSTIVDIHLNGTTIFTTQANRPTLAYNDADKVAKSGVPDISTIQEYDVLTVFIDQVATGASNLSVVIAMSSSTQDSTALNFAACNGRLSLTTGTPVTTSDVSAATTLYFVPYNGDKIGIYSGSAWRITQFTEVSIKLTDSQSGDYTASTGVLSGLTDTSQFIVGMTVTKTAGTGTLGTTPTIASIDSATQVTLTPTGGTDGTITADFKLVKDKNYDIFAYESGASIKLEFCAWTNATTRATALAWQNGMRIKSGVATRRFLGTIRTTATDGQTSDAEQYRYVSNYANQVRRQLKYMYSGSYTYTAPGINSWVTPSWNSVTPTVHAVFCDEQTQCELFGQVVNSHSTSGRYVTTIIAMDGSNAGTGETFYGCIADRCGGPAAIQYMMQPCLRTSKIAVGYHYFNLMSYHETGTQGVLISHWGAGVVGTILG